MLSEDIPAPPGGTPVDYFLATIDAVAKWATELDLDHSGLHRDRLLRLRRRLTFDGDPATLAQGLDALSLILRLLSRGATEQQRMQVERAREMAAILRRAVREFQTRGQRMAQPLHESAVRLAKAAAAIPQGPARAAVELEAAELRRRAEQAAAELSSTMAALQQEFQAVQHCMGPGSAAVIDRVTGLMARPEMERAIRERCEAGRTFWMLTIRIESVEEDGGEVPQIPNRVLQKAAARLSDTVRPQDPLARWAPQEFLAIFDEPAQKLDRRAGELAESLSRSYEIEDGQTIEIRADVAVIEARTGEAAERLFDRLRLPAPDAAVHAPASAVPL